MKCGWVMEDNGVIPKLVWEANTPEISQKFTFNHARCPGIDWSGLTFSGYCMMGMDLRHANLQGTTFRRCDLRDANLTGAILLGCVFDDCRLRDAFRPENDIPGWIANTNGYLIKI